MTFLKRRPLPRKTTRNCFREGRADTPSRSFLLQLSAVLKKGCRLTGPWSFLCFAFLLIFSFASSLLWSKTFDPFLTFALLLLLFLAESVGPRCPRCCFLLLFLSLLLLRL